MGSADSPSLFAAIQGMLGPGELLTRYVLVAEVDDGDGRRLIHRGDDLTPVEGLYPWDALGMFRAGVLLAERACLTNSGPPPEG